MATSRSNVSGLGLTQHQAQGCQQIPAQDGARIDTLSVHSRLSDFWPAYPRLWFTHFEAVMAPQKQGDDARYQAAIARLGLDALQQVSDIIANPPAEDKYGALKARLISAYEESETRKLQKLMEEMELGDQKPSQLLRKMRELAGNKIPDGTLRIMWAKLLPPSVRAVLSVSDTTDLEKLSQVADTVMDSIAPPNQVAQITHASDIATLHEKLAQISLELAEMRKNRESRGRSRSRRISRSRSKTPGGTWICWAHRKHGAQAYSCGNKRKCTFQKPGKQSEN